MEPVGLNEVWANTQPASTQPASAQLALFPHQQQQQQQSQQPLPPPLQQQQQQQQQQTLLLHQQPQQLMPPMQAHLLESSREGLQHEETLRGRVGSAVGKGWMRSKSIKRGASWVTTKMSELDGFVDNDRGLCKCVPCS